MKTKVASICLKSAAVALFLLACKKQDPVPHQEISGPSLPETPYDYNFSFNDNIATLGRVMFYDKNLSLNGSVACGNCHQQDKAFCDNLQFSTGLKSGQTGRNSPSIFAKPGKMFWDGRARDLNDLVLRPVKNHVEMNFEDLNALAKRLSGIGYYQKLFEKSFPNQPIDSNRIKTALAEFLKNFRFMSNRFLESKNDPHALSASEQIGKDIFFGKGNCSKCHILDDPNNPPSSGGWGSSVDPSTPVFNTGLEMTYKDNGFGNVTGKSSDYGKFVVPLLFNIAYTAPYMHDGRFKTLEEVVEHYNSGVYAHENLDLRLRDLGALNNVSAQEQFTALDQNKNGEIEPEEIRQYPPLRLNLSTSEKKSLVDFLKTLSDPSILTDKKFSDPFVN
jgi:cytochrome c peroxidase